MADFGDLDGSFFGRTRGADQVMSLSPNNGFGGTVTGDVTGSLFDRSSGGDDTITVLGRNLTVYGDAVVAIENRARGGDDTIAASGRFGSVFGDAAAMNHFGRGGHDVLRAS